MVAEDVEAVSAIEQASFPSPWTPAMIADELTSGHGGGIVALDDDTLVGYVVTSHIVDELHIQTVAVAATHRRRGLARAMLLDLIQRQGREKIRWVHLEVRDSNTAARRLYESLGFKAVGRRRGYYRNPAEDGVLYTLELPATDSD